MAAAKIIIIGIVQGVFFRFNAREEAQKLGIKGYAKNLPDGSVEIIAVGRSEDIDEFAKWCWEGPDEARVNSVNISEIETDEEYDGFEIR